jgi:cysteinyl-tRNA synthetase
MSEKFLGPEFDIHGGGQDLIFPHHENEIAQSTCMDGSGFAKYWMHNGYLMAEGEKMSKSLGNFYTVHDLLEEFPGEAIRLALLKTHYRQPLDFTKAGILEAKRELDSFYEALQRVSKIDPITNNSDNSRTVLALQDDLNTPSALSYLHSRRKLLNKLPMKGIEALAEEKGQLLDGGKILGLLQQDPEDWFKGGASEDGIDDAAIDALIEKRTEARNNKDFNRSDEIRDQLANAGILLEDGAEGTTWKRS